MNRLTALEQTVLKLSDLPSQVQQILSAVNPAPDSAARRSRSVSLSSSSSSRLPSRSPPRKAPRHVAPQSYHGSSARTRAFSSSSSNYSDDIEDEIESVHDIEPSGSASAPPASGNWQRIPSDWEVRPIDDSWVAYGPPPEDGQATSSTGQRLMVPYHDLEIYTQRTDSGRIHFFRPRTHSTEATRTLRERASQVPTALASLSAWAKGSPSPGPHIHLSGHGRRMEGCGIKGVTLSPALSLSTMSATWAAKAAGDNSTGTDRDESRGDPKPIKQTWPESSIEHKAILFLQESTRDHGILPGGLTAPAESHVKKDKEARATAHRLLQVNANMEILSGALGAAASSTRSWSTQDVQTFISSTKTALDGISALLTPFTRDMIREAISKRVTLRQQAIPGDLDPLKSQLLGLDPLSPYFYGPRETVSTIVNSRPPPAVVEIKGLSQGTWKSQPQKGGHNKGNGGRSSNSKGRSGGGKN